MRVDFKSLEQKIALQVIILGELFLLSLTIINKIGQLFFFLKHFIKVVLHVIVSRTERGWLS